MGSVICVGLGIVVFVLGFVAGVLVERKRWV